MLFLPWCRTIGYDGGDCCICTCFVTPTRACGDDGEYDCVDPGASCDIDDQGDDGSESDDGGGSDRYSSDSDDDGGVVPLDEGEDEGEVLFGRG